MPPKKKLKQDSSDSGNADLEVVPKRRGRPPKVKSEAQTIAQLAPAKQESEHAPDTAPSSAISTEAKTDLPRKRGRPPGTGKKQKAAAAAAEGEGGSSQANGHLGAMKSPKQEQNGSRRRKGIPTKAE